MRKPKKPPVKAKVKTPKKPVKKRGLKVHGKPVVPHHPIRNHPAHHPHHAHHQPAKVKAPKKRLWSPGWDVACCSAEALGLLLGWDWQQVLELYWRTASEPDVGATIRSTLEAVADLPRFAPLVQPRAQILPTPAMAAVASEAAQHPHGLILGLQLEEPHAVAVTPDGRWWSWGEPFNPGDWPELIIDEAWAVLCAG